MDSEKCTEDVENAAKCFSAIIVISDSEITQKKNGNKENCQVNPCNKNKSNKRNEENTSKPIEQTMSNKI